MHRFRLPLALALVLAPTLAARPALAQPACQDVAGNIVVNCGFEGSTYTGTNGLPQPTGYTVTFANGGTLALASSSATRNGGRGYVFADKSPASATLAQVLTTTVGTPYQIVFYALNAAGANPNNGLTVTFGDLLLRTGPLVNQAYQQFTYTAFATSTSTRLAFTGFNGRSITGIDDLSVVALATTAPEPATWALFGTGLLAVGGMARRRRGTQA